MLEPPLWDSFMPGLLDFVDQPPRDPEKTRTAIRLLSAVTLSAIVGILIIGLVSMMLIRRHRRKLANTEAKRRGKQRPPPDPWFESARRVPDPPGGPKSRVFPLPHPDEPDPRRRPRRSGEVSGADDDTVDLDPDELDQRDVEGDDDEPPDEGSPPPSKPPGGPNPPPADPTQSPGSRGG